MQVLAALLRAFSYLFHLILALFLLGLSIVTIATGQHILSLGMLPWRGAELTYWLLGLSLFALCCVALAITGKFRIPLVVWSAAVLVLLVRGFLLSPYRFSGPSGARVAMLLILGAFLALLGSLAFEKNRRQSYR